MATTRRERNFFLSNTGAWVMLFGATPPTNKQNADALRETSAARHRRKRFVC
jgi:hypothetical protein